MPRKREPEYFIAISSGSLRVDGKIETFVRGRTVVHRSAALYRAHPDMFRPIEHPTIEQATAAPGEKRG